MSPHTSLLSLALPAVALVMLLGSPAGAVEAGEGPRIVEPRTSYVDVVKEFMSVTCQGEALDICTSPASEEVKTWIRDKVAAGWTKGEIVDAVVADFGERILAVSPRRGIVWSLWVLPAAIAAAGGVVVTLLLRRSSGDAPATGVELGVAGIDRARLDEIERELREDA